jgi:IPT/TIG domain
MALVTIPPGQNIIAWTGPATTLAQAPWFTVANLNGIYKPSANRLGFISCKPGAAFPGFTQITPASSGIPVCYIFNVKAAFSLDDSLMGVVSTLPAAPTISSISPTSGAAGDTVTITGTNLSNALGVSFGSVLAGTPSANTATSITAVVPSLAITGNVRVITAGGVATGPGFSVAAPTLAAPAQPIAQAISVAQLNVAASSVANATGYKLYRSTSQTGTFTQVGGTLLTPSYSDSSLSPGTMYWYKWQALGNGTTTADSLLAATQPFSGQTPAARGTLEVRGTGASQSNGAGASPREETPISYYLDNSRAYGFDKGRNAIEKWSLGTVVNGIPDQSTSNDHGFFPYTYPPYGGVGPGAGFVKQWMENNAANAKELLYYALDTTQPDNNNSTTARWLELLLNWWKAEWTQMVGLVKARGWTGIRVVLFHDLGEGNAMTNTVGAYYADMVNIISQMEAHILSFAGAGFTASVLGHGIVWKQQNYTESGGTVRNIAGLINPLQTQLVDNVAKAFKVEMPNVDVVSSFQDQYGNNTRIHYTTPEILRLGEYYATVENSLDIGLVFKDEFTDPAVLTAQWATDGFTGTPGTVEVANGKLQLSPAANVSGVNLTGLRTRNRLAFNGRRFIIDIQQIPAGVHDVAVGTQTTLGDAQYMVYLMVEAGRLYCGDGYTFAAGADTPIPFNISSMRFLAIRVTATDVLWQTSPDGILWTTHATKPISQIAASDWQASQLYLTIFANTATSTPNPGTVLIESAKLEIV